MPNGNAVAQATRMERGVYIDDMGCEGYLGFRVFDSRGKMRLESRMDVADVDAQTEELFWRWLAQKDPIEFDPTVHLTLLPD